MEPAELRILLELRISTLTTQRTAAARLGDVERVLALDADIAATETAIADLD